MDSNQNPTVIDLMLEYYDTNPQTTFRTMDSKNLIK